MTKKVANKAMELLAKAVSDLDGNEKKVADAAKKILTFEPQGIEVLNGRYGPYVTNGEKNAKVPKDIEPNTLTLAACEELLAAAPTRRNRKKKAKKK